VKVVFPNCLFVLDVIVHTSDGCILCFGAAV